MTRLRPVPALAALAILAFVWSPLLGDLFPAGMIRHMALVAVVPPLIVLAWPVWPELPTGLVLVAAAVEFALVWGWHLPGALIYARSDGVGLVLEQGSFLAAGILVWSGSLAAREPLAGAGGLLLTAMHMTLLGALLVLAPRPLYAFCTPTLESQQLGGILMLAIGTPIYLAGGLWLAGRALGMPQGARP
ncbi:putative membrane protein [Palleronia aestuarii]|uniref:Putative membrane protein n=1 Tax=Palleronia aestuarii TaxID=568105 RepID=A0A2W7P010_9RHOB|nr:cytochrome c oxidase assembly protein [Palleronia aestuarii]PZX18806.1 putative membrane protein [Palleronia aestuarii]